MSECSGFRAKGRVGRNSGARQDPDSRFSRDTMPPNTPFSWLLNACLFSRGTLLRSTIRCKSLKLRCRCFAPEGKTILSRSLTKSLATPALEEGLYESDGG